MVDLIQKEITAQIIASAFEVGNILGAGFLEKLYENALKVELELRNLKVETQQQIIVSYKGKDIGLYKTDLVVDGKVIVEIKCVESIARVHRAQIINYLKATGLEVGLIINFGGFKVGFERIVLQHKNDN